MWKRKYIDVDIFDATYQEIITASVLNTMLNHVGTLWIIENIEQLKYDMDIKIQFGWQVVHGIPHLFVKNYIEYCLRDEL